MQSTQESDDFQICNCVCNFCLSIDRRTTPVIHLPESLLHWTPFAIYSQSSQLCWECKARLKNYSEFCERSERAQELLNQVNTQESLKGKSVSRLVTSSTLVISVDSQIQDDNHKSSSEDTRWVQAIETIKCEPEALKEEDAISADLETRNESISESANESDYDYEPGNSNKCDELMSAVNITMTRDDKFVSKPAAAKDDRAEINKFIEVTVESTPNVTKTKKRRLGAKKSCAVNFANWEVDYALYEKFTATEDEMQEYLKPISFINKCKMCLREFRTIENFMVHMKNFHSDCVGDHKCDVCGFGQPTEAALKLHREHHYVLYRCLADGCRFVHKFPPTLKAHQTLHENAEKNAGTYACRHCKRKFKKLCNVYKHIKLAHVDATKCKHCGKHFPDVNSLHRHIKSNHGDKMLVCDICGVEFVTMRRLQVHLILHRNVNQERFACKICNKSFNCRFKERLHQFVHNGKPRIKCHICKTEFIEEEARLKHFENRHGISREEAAKTPISTKKRYRKRGERKGDPKTCHVCGVEFKYPSMLEYHVMTRHSDDRPFKCHICSDGFKTKPILENHVRKHSQERAFKCDICNKSFKYAPNLYTHKLLHSGEKPFMCNICSASFALKGNLKGHMKIHTGEKPFDCTVCAKKFPSNSCLKKHSRVH